MPTEPVRKPIADMDSKRYHLEQSGGFSRVVEELANPVRAIGTFVAALAKLFRER
jgi:hypothetical protein